MFAEMKRVFGLVPPPTSIESVYPETLFIPIGPEIQGLNIAGRIAKKSDNLKSRFTGYLGEVQECLESRGLLSVLNFTDDSIEILQGYLIGTQVRF